jgi:hypothetical protein
MQVWIYVSSNGDHVTEYEYSDGDDDNHTMAIIPQVKIKKALPKVPPERKVVLGKCLCGERVEDILKKAKSFLQERRGNDGRLVMSKKDTDALQNLIIKVVSIFI